MKWYDLISPVYDIAIRSLYAPYRKMLIEQLDVRSGETVLDLGCGSGLNFELLMAKIGPRGTLIGVDYSAKMLARAQKLVDKNGWKNVQLLKQNVSKLDAASFKVLMGPNFVADKIICTLGMSVFPEWEAVFDNTYTILKKRGKYGLLDLFNSDHTFSTKLVNLLANSQINREVWKPLKARSMDFNMKKHKAMPHGNDVIVIAIGTKS